MTIIILIYKPNFSLLSQTTPTKRQMFALQTTTNNLNNQHTIATNEVTLANSHEVTVSYVDSPMVFNDSEAKPANHFACIKASHHRQQSSSTECSSSCKVS